MLSRDLSDFNPQEIPNTKMKKDIMRDQLSNPIRFIIEKPFSNNIDGKKFSEIGIESKQTLTGGGKREWVYIIDRPKIVAKLRGNQSIFQHCIFEFKQQFCQ